MSRRSYTSVRHHRTKTMRERVFENEDPADRAALLVLIVWIVRRPWRASANGFPDDRTGGAKLRRRRFGQAID
jgi:hypothetical protein